MSLLNSSINSLSLYLLLFATLLNFYTNSFIILLSCSIFFKSTTFNVLLSSLLNSCFRSIRNSTTIVYTKLLLSKSSIIFSFQISADPLCTYNNTHYTCFSTDTSLISILMYNLYAIKKPRTFLVFLLNVCDLATSMFDLVLGLEIITAAFSFASHTVSICIYAYIATNYF